MRMILAATIAAALAGPAPSKIIEAASTALIAATKPLKDALAAFPRPADAIQNLRRNRQQKIIQLAWG